MSLGREDRDRALFDKIAEKYARKDSVVSSSLARKSQLFSAIGPLLEKAGGLGTVVEIGCGIGATAKYLEGRYDRYIGIDYSEKLIEKAREFNRGVHNSEFIAGNIKTTGFPRGIADLVLSIGVLHHVTELDVVMRSLVYLARPGALFVVVEPYNGNLFVQMIRRAAALFMPSYSSEQIYFSEEDLKGLFQCWGIEDISVSFQGFFSPLFAQNVMQPQFLMIPLSRLAISFDKWLDVNSPPALRKLSVNIVMTGTFSSVQGGRL